MRPCVPRLFGVFIFERKQSTSNRVARVNLESRGVKLNTLIEKNGRLGRVRVRRCRHEGFFDRQF